MPELPEVETIRRGLIPVIVGVVTEAVTISDQRLTLPEPVVRIESALHGRTCVNIVRRGKYLVFEYDSGAALEVHLRMTGSFAVGRDDAPPQARHVRARFELAGGTMLVYNDPRRFGTFRLGSIDEIHDRLASVLGPEPMDISWSADSLRDRLRNRRISIKAALLDQRVVAGLGNIYVDEALFLSNIHPARSARSIRVYELRNLIDAVRERLSTAIDAGGSTLRDYRGVEGADGTMQEQFVAYGRQGKACRRCGDIMMGGRIAGRGTCWCTSCQPRVPHRRCQ